MNKEENLDMILHILTTAKICAEYLVKDFFQTKAKISLDQIPSIMDMNSELYEIKDEYNKKINKINIKLDRLNKNKIKSQERLETLGNSKKIDSQFFATLKRTNLSENIKVKEEQVSKLENSKNQFLEEKSKKINECKEKYLVVDEKDRSVLEAFEQYKKLNLEINEVNELKEFLSREPYFQFKNTKNFAKYIISTINASENFKGKFEVEAVTPSISKIDYEDQLKVSPYYNRNHEGYVLKNVENGKALYLGCNTLTVSKTEFNYVIKELNNFVGKEIGDKVVDYVYEGACKKYKQHEINYGYHTNGVELNDRLL